MVCPRFSRFSTLGIVVPTLDAAATIGATLASLAEGRGLIAEVVVADGGSRDGTRAIAAAAGARVVTAPAGRGSQLAAGAAAVAGEWLLFLHADTRLAPGWAAEAARFIAAAQSRERAAVFRFALDDGRVAARRLEALVAWRGRALGLPYGDQGLLIARPLYDALGGFPALPLMEDVALVRRLGRRRLVFLETAAITSAARYRCEGYLARSLRNLACLGLYFARVPPRLIVRLYRR